MQRYGGRMAAPALLALLVALGGCQAASTTAADSGARAGGLFGMPWGGMTPPIIKDSLTIARLRGAEVAPVAPLQPEPGNVWPAEEAPRATLANPDAALRGIPAYRPGEPRPVDGLLAPEPLSRRGAPGRLRGSSVPPPAPLDLPELPQAAAPPSRLPPLPAPPPPRVEGQTVPTPQGPAVTGAGTNRTGSVLMPGGGTGIITRDGPNVTITGPDGGIQTVPAPR